MKKTFTSFLSIITLVIITCFVSCSNDAGNSQNQTDWPYPVNQLTDITVNPGDDFYSYSNGTWLKNNPVSGTTNRILYASNPNYDVNTLKSILINSTDPVISRLMSEAGNQDTSEETLKAIQEKTNAQLAEIDSLSTLNDVISKAALLSMQGYKTCIQICLYPMQGKTRLILADNIQDVLTAEGWMNMTGCTQEEAETLVSDCTSILKDWYFRISSVPSKKQFSDSIPALNNLADTLGEDVSCLLIDGDYLSDFLKYTITDSQIENWKLILRQAIVSFNYRWTYATKESLAEYFIEQWHPFSYRVTKIYYEKYKGEIMKDFASQMVEEIREAFIETVNENTWLSDETKQNAVNKAKAITKYIGFSDSFQEERLGSVPEGTTLLQDMELAGKEWEQIVKAAVSDNPSEDDIWFSISQSEIRPYLFNAAFIPESSILTICIPTLLPNACRKDVPDSYNYGMLGAVTGHEFGHGFDSSGSLRGATGAWENWWTEEDREEFNTRTAKLASYNSQYKPLPETHPELYSNGQQTNTEDAADLIGLNLALKAMIKHYKAKGAGEDEILRAKQEFFLAFANLFAVNLSEIYKLYVVTMNSHSIFPLRINGTVRNIDSWYDVYNIKNTDSLYRASEDRVRIY